MLNLWNVQYNQVSQWVWTSVKVWNLKYAVQGPERILSLIQDFRKMKYWQCIINIYMLLSYDNLAKFSMLECYHIQMVAVNSVWAAKRKPFFGERSGKKVCFIQPKSKNSVTSYKGHYNNINSLFCTIIIILMKL